MTVTLARARAKYTETVHYFFKHRRFEKDKVSFKLVKTQIQIVFVKIETLLIGN